MEPLPQIEGHIVFLPTEDLEQTDRFYRSVLGFRLALDQGACRIYTLPGGGYWGFCTHSQAMADPGRVVLTLLVADVAKWHFALARAGVPVDGPPRVNDAFRIEHFYATDPNGYRVEVQRFLDAFPPA